MMKSIREFSSIIDRYAFEGNPFLNEFAASCKPAMKCLLFSLLLYGLCM
jgi:hypothetical protein